MNRRTTAITMIAGALMVGTPAFAAARPAPPDPPPRHVETADRDITLADLVAAYRTATTAEKRRIHSEITMILHHSPQGWTI